MRKVFTYILLAMVTMTGCGKAAAGDVVRPMAVAGQFYPESRKVLDKYMKEFFKDLPRGGQHVQAVIVPHAGYVFSGAVAARAYAEVAPEREYEHVFLLGPSHYAYIKGASVCNAYDAYDTPYGPVPVDRALCDTLMAAGDCFTYDPRAHTQEHCLEVQLPLLKYRLRHMPPIVPIVIGTEDIGLLQQVAEALRPYFNEKNLFVISSDFSHYPAYDDAVAADRRTGEAIATGDLYRFAEALQQNDSLKINGLVTSACGQSAIAVLLMLQEGGKYAIRHLAYANSGDSDYADRRKVVGYHAFAVEAGEGESATDFALTEDEKKALLTIARNAIGRRFGRASQPADLTPALKTRCGAFVSLHMGQDLRGCIGHFGSDVPLHKVVEEMARSAAFRDPRFYPLSEGELDKVAIEISVLTPLKRIYSLDEFQLHRDGIYIVKGNRSGTFLPQVADEVNWSKEEFVGHCSQDKAGLGWNGWKDAELYTYRAIIFCE